MMTLASCVFETLTEAEEQLLTDAIATMLARSEPEDLDDDPSVDFVFPSLEPLAGNSSFVGL